MFGKLVISFLVGVHVGQTYKGIPPVADVATKLISEFEQKLKEIETDNKKASK